jgi:hypothetical protein
MKRTASTGLLAGLLLTGLCAGGCAERMHMTRNYGRSVGAAMSAQVANPTAGDKKRSESGFDAQEASIVAKGYRSSLAPRNDGDRDDRGMVILAAPAPASGGSLPPPSVPERK